MATSLASAVDSVTDIIDDQNVPALPQGQVFTGIYVYDSGGDMTYMASQAQVRAALFTAAPANQSPLVTLTISANGITLGQSTVLTATATDPDGTIVAGTFYANGVPIAPFTGPTAPPSTYAFTYTPTAVGTTQISFVGLDNGGATAVASLPLVVVAAPVVSPSAPGNALPGVSLEASPNNINLGQSTQLVASAIDSDGSIAALEIYTDATLSTQLASGATGSLTFAWQPPAAGQKLPVARATDNQGGVSVSPPAPVMVNGPTTPLVYNGVLSATLPQESPGQSEGVVWGGDGSQRVEFAKISDTKGNIAQLQITDSSGGAMVFLSYPDEYVGKSFTFYRANGTSSTQPFPADGTNLTL